jgi:dTDP-4-amino-4,6-dideoxygalactose transaminase
VLTRRYEARSLTVVAEHSGRVAGILAYSTFGSAPRAAVTGEWESIAQQWGLPLIVDSAAGFGSLCGDGSPLDAQGDAEIFSFYTTKPLAIGEEGAIATRSSELAKRLRRIANFGFDSRRQVTEPLGLNGKMSDLHATEGLAALDSLSEQLAARREHAAELQARLRPAGFEFQYSPAPPARRFVPALAPNHATREAALKVCETRRIVRSAPNISRSIGCGSSPRHALRPSSGQPKTCPHCPSRSSPWT